MNWLDQIRRQLQEVHPRKEPDLIRQAIGETDGRIAKLENDVEALREAWWVEGSRLGDHPRPGEEPFIDPEKDRVARNYMGAGKVAVWFEIALAFLLGWGRISGIPGFASALLCALFACAIARITRGVVPAWLRDDDRPLETRTRLKRASALGGVAVLLAFVPLLLPLRGRAEESLDVAIPVTMVFLTFGLSIAGACLLELGETYAQKTARAYHAAVHELECERLFRQELQRELENHPFAVRNGRGHRSRISGAAAGFVLALLLPAFARAETFRCVHVLVDTTGSIDRSTLVSTISVLSASLPALALRLNLQTVEVSGWGSSSTWTPAGRVFLLPPPVPEPHVAADAPLGQYFVSIAEARTRKAEALQERARADADRRRAELIKSACVEPAAALRGLTEAGRVPESKCSPIDELLCRVSLEPPTRLTLLLTDVVGCDKDVAVPSSSTSRTIVIVLPAHTKRAGSSVMVALAKLKAPWLTVVPASTLDPEGVWIDRLLASPSANAESSMESGQ